MTNETAAEFVMNSYEIHERRHAIAILKNDFPDE